MKHATSMLDVHVCVVGCLLLLEVLIWEFQHKARSFTIQLPVPEESTDLKHFLSWNIVEITLLDLMSPFWNYVVSTSYVLHTRVTPTGHFAETPHWSACHSNLWGSTHLPSIISSHSEHNWIHDQICGPDSQPTELCNLKVQDLSCKTGLGTNFWRLSCIWDASGQQIFLFLFTSEHYIFQLQCFCVLDRTSLHNTLQVFVLGRNAEMSTTQQAKYSTGATGVSKKYQMTSLLKLWKFIWMEMPSLFWLLEPSAIWLNVGFLTWFTTKYHLWTRMLLQDCNHSAHCGFLSTKCHLSSPMKFPLN